MPYHIHTKFLKDGTVLPMLKVHSCIKAISISLEFHQGQVKVNSVKQIT